MKTVRMVPPGGGAPTAMPDFRVEEMEKRGWKIEQPRGKSKTEKPPASSD